MLLGAWLTSKGLGGGELLNADTALGIAIIFVTQGWSFWRIYRRSIFERLIALTGIQADPETSPEMVIGEAKKELKNAP